MKTQHLLYLTGVIFIIAVFLMTSCNKDEDVIVNDEVTEEDAVEVVETAVSEESGGLTEQIENAAEIANYADPEQNPMCGMSFDSTILLTNVSGSTILYNYEYLWNWNVQCNELQIPEKFSFSYEMEGWYDSPRLKSNDSGFNDFSIAGLSISDTTYIYSGTYSRNGSNEMKTGLQTTFSSELTIVINEIVLSKTTWEILEGSGNVSFTGKTSGGKNVTFQGTITFNGGDTATLKFENEFTINL